MYFHKKRCKGVKRPLQAFVYSFTCDILIVYTILISNNITIDASHSNHVLQQDVTKMKDYPPQSAYVFI